MNTARELVQAEELTIDYPTYSVGEPERHPLFFEKRVYQGSNGKVYPLPFIDKVFDVREVRSYRAIRLENDFVRVCSFPSSEAAFMRSRIRPTMTMTSFITRK